jgi:alpha-amylase
MPTALYLTLLYYKMNDAFDGNNLTCWTMIWCGKEIHTKPLLFNNHDTDEIYNKQLAYAYILTHEGYPTLFTRLRGMAR